MGRLIPVGKLEILAKIAPVFIHYPIRLGFLAIIVHPRRIKPAVQAAMQLCAAPLTFFPEANLGRQIQGLSASLAKQHSLHLIGLIT